MSGINIAIPVFKGRMVFIVDKGRPWSVVEHLILEALSKREWTTQDLATAACISRRVVVEAIIRLMRAGWVELLQSGSGVSFHATPRGASAASKSELPNVLERKNRPTSFIVDRVVGNVFRNWEWTTVHEKDLRERSKKEPFIWLEDVAIQSFLNPNDLVDALLDDDETFVDGVPSGLLKRYVIATVRDGIIEGLPDRELPELCQIILAAAKSTVVPATGVPSIYRITSEQLPAKPTFPELRNIAFDPSDLILDGNAHKLLLRRIFADARRKIFIHSTFLNEERFLEFLPDIAKAVSRGPRRPPKLPQ